MKTQVVLPEPIFAISGSRSCQFDSGPLLLDSDDADSAYCSDVVLYSHLAKLLVKPQLFDDLEEGSKPPSWSVTENLLARNAAKPQSTI